MTKLFYKKKLKMISCRASHSRKNFPLSSPPPPPFNQNIFLAEMLQNEKSHQKPHQKHTLSVIPCC